MNGLLVTLPLLLLLFPSLYASHAPILVLEKMAGAIRVWLHSWVLNNSGERGGCRGGAEGAGAAQGWGRGGPQKAAAEKTVLCTRSGRWRRTGGEVAPSSCVIGLSVWFSVSYQLSPAVGQSQNSQNATLPAQSKCASSGVRGGGGGFEQR